MLFRSVEFNFVDRFLIYAMVHKLSPLNMTYEFSCVHNNNSVTIKEMKNLPTKMNYTDLITPQTKFQSPPMKDKRKHSFLVSSYSIVKYKTLVPNILSTPFSHSSFETFISELVLEKAFRK